MNGLIRFVQLVDADAELQAQIACAPHPGAIVSLGAQLDCVFSIQELRQASRDLSAAYWPWAAKGNAFRRRWFAQVV